MASDNAPRRAYVLELKIGADSRNDLIGALRQLEFLIEAEELTAGVSGGYGSGYTYKLDVDESITHESYMAAIEQFLTKAKENEHA